jgi:hypothetical protein
MIIIDNFLTNPDQIRQDALDLTYTKAEPNSPGWRGFRCLYTNMVGDEVYELIKDKLEELDPIEFSGALMRCYFHYTINEDMSSTIHTDGVFDYAGVLYLTPNPSPNSGTVFYNDNNEEIDYVENVYNRLTIYPSNIPHRIKESFGDDLTNGRLVYTIFLKTTCTPEKLVYKDKQVDLK